MIEAAIAYRARPKCSRCGWTGDWRSSTSSIATAERRATAQLQEHEQLWHPGATS